MALGQRQPVVVARGEIADVQLGSGETRELHRLPFRQEAIGDAALIEYLNGPRVQTAGARSIELLGGAPLDNGHVDARQGQLARQHQPRRAASGYDHRMLSQSGTLRRA